MASENPLRGEERIANELLLKHGQRVFPARLVRVAVTAHRSAAWTLRQMREVVGFDPARRYVIHDRDSVFASSLDESIWNLGLTVLESPPYSPKAQACRTLQRASCRLRHRQPAIESASPSGCAPDRCWVACITNICWRPR